MKKAKPTTPGRRGMTHVSYKKVVTKSKPHKALTRGRKRAVGRQSAGRITTRHKGGGAKRLYREIDFKYNKHDIPAKIETIEYDPNRSAYIALVVYRDGERRYVVVPKDMKVDDTFVVSENASPTTGNRTLLSNISVGTGVYNVELKPGSGAKIARSAGVNAEVVAQDGGTTHVKLASGEVRKVPGKAWASIGAVSNEEHRLTNIGKAGRARHMGRRPTVRGSAMNTVDHPHGGGEGRQGISLRRGPKTRQGKLAYGVKTRKTKKYSDNLIVSRRKKKKRK